MGSLFFVQAFRSIQSNQGLTLDSGHYDRVTLPLVQSRDHVFGGARPAGLGFLLFWPNFVHVVPAFKYSPKVVELDNICEFGMNMTFVS